MGSGGPIAGGNNNCPQACTMEYKPVCDSNSNTHGNKCAFDIAACEARKMGLTLTMVKDGPCDGTSNVGSVPGESCLKACPFSWMPVCDSNGKTHANKCVFEGAACEARKKGILISIVKEVACEDSSNSRPGGLNPDECVGAGCKCPPGFTGVEPFCMEEIGTSMPVPTAPGATCVDGTVKKESCNTCRCSNGIWACTLMACPEDLTPTSPVSGFPVSGTC